MNIKNNLKFTASLSKVFMTIVILLFVLFILQIITIEVSHEINRMFKSETTTKEIIEPKKELSKEEKHLELIRNSSKRFLPDGTILQVYSTSDHYHPQYGRRPNRENAKLQICDVNGTLLWEGLRKDNPYEYLSWPSRPNDYIDDRRINGYRMVTPELSRSLEIPVRSQEKTLEIWRYHWEKEYFIGYNTAEGKIGYIGSEGFTESKSNATPFGTFKFFTAWCPEDSYSPILLWQTKRKIYQIDFERQKLKLIFESQESDIKRFGWRKWRLDTEELPQNSSLNYRPAIHCQTEDGKHYLIMQEPEQQVAINIPEDWQSDFVRPTATTKGIFLNYYSRSPLIPQEYLKSPKLIEQWTEKNKGKPINRWFELYKVDDAGNLELINRFDQTIPAPKGHTTIRHPKRKLQWYVNSTSTVLYDIVWKVFGQSLRQKSRGSESFIAACSEIIVQSRPGDSILNLMLSAAMMAFAFWHGWARRTSWAKFISWLIFVGVFNLAGLLTYLALNHTAVIKCAVCGKRRGLEQVECVRCGEQLPAPQPGKLDLIFTT
ncbi:MAG: hypothetical protein ACYS1A_14770 [Planctomycetota bacterium]|jgi:hypothetical protein